MSFFSDALPPPSLRPHSPGCPQGAKKGTCVLKAKGRGSPEGAWKTEEKEEEGRG